MKEQIEHHAREEEERSSLLKVKQLIDADVLDALGGPLETDAAASLR